MPDWSFTPVLFAEPGDTRWKDDVRVASVGAGLPLVGPWSRELRFLLLFCIEVVSGTSGLASASGYVATSVMLVLFV